MKFLQKNNNGFTLAEVLITLVIVGIIAAMTIPTLINKTNKQEYVVRLKKAYSTIAQATNMIIAEKGSPDNWNLKGTGSYVETSEKFGNLYKKYLSKSKECTSGETGCFGSVTYKDMNGITKTFVNDKNYYRIMLADGMTVLFDGNVSDNCSGGVCAYMFVDTNGAKGPNITGRDVFLFYLDKGGLKPGGCHDDTDVTQQCLGNNHNCTCKVLHENAMNY